MKSRLIGFCLPLTVIASAWCADGAGPKRVPWTTSRIHGSPDPAKPFVAQRIYPKLEFKEALEIVFEPVAKRWFVLEKNGRILSWPNDGEADHADLVADIKALHPDLDYLYGIAFHPKFAENHQVFITYTRGAGIDDGTKLSRFIINPGSAGIPAGSRSERPTTSATPLLDITSEQVLLTWRSGGHNGANLQFGPDGMLYISTGDSEVPSPPDPLNTGQDISDLLSSILRIDVDHTDPGLAYAIPKDNPFVGQMVESAQAKERRLPGVGRRQDAVSPSGLAPARGEVWAYGLRNPWKMSFDRATGRLWCGDVGWELWEMIHLIERGGNYGWSAMEAGQPVRADAPKPPTPIRPPVVAHSHDEAASITGGHVYHGKKFPELEGAYIYGDWVTGKIWALWHDGRQVTRHEEIADTHHKIIAFGNTESGKGFPEGKMPLPLSSTDNDGIYYLDYSEKGALYELTRNKAEKTEKFPTKLSETGLFKDVAKQAPANGVYQFVINQPMWQDYAIATVIDEGYAYPARWIALPNSDRIDTTSEIHESKDGSVKATHKTTWPKNSVLVKTLGLTTAPGNSENFKPVETQLLHFDGESWNAYSYRWNDIATDADLVAAPGEELSIKIAEKNQPSGHRDYRWRFGSRAECMRCHNSWTGYTLGFEPSQLEVGMTIHLGEPPFRRITREELADARPKCGGVLYSINELDLFRDHGLYNGGFLDRERVKLARAFGGTRKMMEPSWSIGDHSRSYLHVNCSHCHRQNAGGAVNMFLNAELLLGQTRTVGVTPQQGGLGLAKPKLIDPGNPWNSVIALRIAKPGTGHMPVIGPHEVDVEGLKLIEDWIARMGDKATSAADLLPKEWSESLLKDKLATVDGAMQVLRAVDDGLIKEPLRQKTLDLAWSSPLPTVRDLFDRFLPDDKRVETLGPNPDAKNILALQGDAARGSQLLSPQGKLAACFACHLINGAGRDFGPDLSKVATRLKPEQILESLLQPSKVIAQGYQGVSVETNDGAMQVGFIVKDSAGDLSVKTAIGQTVTVQKSNITKQSKLPASLMPEGLAQSLAAQEAADLIAFLNSLK